MAIYILYLGLTGIQFPLFYRKNRFGVQYHDTKNYLTICCVELILLAGLRGYSIGADTPLYLEAIDYYSIMKPLELIRAKLIYPFDFETGYFLLNKVCILFGLGKTEFLFVIAMLIYIPIFGAIKKYSYAPYISILCYFAFGYFTYSLGIFRQMIAVSLLIYSSKYIVEKKTIKYLLMVILAMTFHTTAIIGILLYIIYNRFDWRKIVKLVIVIEMIFLTIGRRIVMLILLMFPKYTGYVNGKYDQTGGSYVMLLFLNIILFTMCIFEWKSNEKKNLTISALVLAVLFQSLGYSMTILGRVVSYYSIYIIFAIPNLLAKFTYKTRVWITMVLIIFLYILIYLEFAGNRYVTPYYFLLSVRDIIRSEKLF